MLSSLHLTMDNGANDAAVGLFRLNYNAARGPAFKFLSRRTAVASVVSLEFK